MYTEGQIITKQEHVAFANWNNANGGKFRSESLGDDTYKITEIVIPEPTVEDNIASLKAKLSASDYIGNKLAEALTDEERQALLIEYNELIQLRRQWRIEINSFEAILASQ